MGVRLFVDVVIYRKKIMCFLKTISCINFDLYMNAHRFVISIERISIRVSKRNMSTNIHRI